ncbi:terminase TerL endonuclease subunit [Aerococcus kribbianus]|uniref:Terminase large subunit n=1 Tax=Aerococcus kribbianus TaxID=2999064 RepID=A0A9X3FQG5_9LACT|nr:terminase TerL endonuclease subunit [Aerococcus sp. YH-aer222]MCZ0726126.1 terminase large subunit [Aerococcus sp. YH-aer222]
MLENSYVDDYIKRVKNGEMVVNTKRKQLIDFLEKKILPYDDLYYYDEQKLNDYIQFSEQWYYPLDAWEKFIAAFVFLMEYETEDVVFNQFVLIIGRGAGKNGFISTLAHYFISSLHGVNAYDITLVANSERQAKRSLNDVRLCVNKKGHEALNAHPPEDYLGEPGEFEAYKSRVSSLETQSEILFVAANSSTLDGGREGCIFYDEFHEMPDSSIPDVLGGGIGKVDYGRQFFIGTKGFVRGAYFDSKYNRCEDILNGEADYNGIFPFICELDDIDEMDDESKWAKANPALDKPLNKRGKRLLKTIRDEYSELVYTPSKRPAFVTKRMNLIEGDMEHSVASKEELEATIQPLFNLDGLIPIGGLDYGSVRDFASCGLLFKRGEEYSFINHSFVIKQFVDVHYGYSNSANMDGGGRKAPIRKWEKEGHLTVIDEPSLNPHHIIDWFIDAREKYGVQKIVADNYKMDILRPLFEDEGFEVEVIKRPQSVHPLLAPRVEDGFANHKFKFGNNEMMRWFTSNVYVKETNAGKIFDKKEEVKRKTDGFHALLYALYCANELDDQIDVDSFLDFTSSLNW